MENKMVIELPKIVNGQIIYGDSETEMQCICYPNGIEVHIPKFTMEDVESIKENKSEISKEMIKLTISDIAQYISEVGVLWLEYKLEGRKLVSKYTHLITEFSEVITETDFKTVGDFMVQRFHIYDQVESEFGTDRIFDEWIPRQMCYVKAFPRGLSLHYLVGNLPLAAIFSVIRGIITKNITVAKLASRDPVSAIGFMHSLIEVNPQHPISRSLSAGYWERDDKVGDAIISIADTVCAWGGYGAIESIKKKIPPEVTFAEYGPKWSVSVIDLEQCDIESAAYRVVEDVAFYDQEACFNTQQIYVHGEKIEEFIEYLIKYCREFSKSIPICNTNIDIAANRSLAIKEAQCLGYKTVYEKDWAIIIADGSHSITHPFNRTFILHPIKKFEDVTKNLNRSNQTMSVYPWSIIKEYRDEWTEAGICRYVELGWSRMFRSGYTHDGTYGMHPMVRLACIERPWSDRGKYYGVRKDLEHHWFKELHPGMRKLIDERNRRKEEGKL